MEERFRTKIKTAAPYVGEESARGEICATDILEKLPGRVEIGSVPLATTDASKIYHVMSYNPRDNRFECEFVLKVTQLKFDNEEDTKKAAMLFEAYKKLGEENPHFLEFCKYSYKELEGTGVQVEMLLENLGDQTLAKIRNPSRVDIKQWMIQLILSFAYMQKRGICRPDIKLENIFLKNGILRLKGDIRKQGYHPAYAAPEILKEEMSKGNTASDVYAFGMLMYQLICKKSILELEKERENHAKITRDDYEKTFLDSVSKNKLMAEIDDNNKIVMNMVLNCLKYEPKERATFESMMMDLLSMKKVLNVERDGYANEVHGSYVLSKIAYSYTNLFEDHKLALILQEKATNVRCKWLVENHFNVAVAYNNLGYNYSCIGDKGKALESYEKSFKITSNILKEASSTTATTYCNLGTAQRAIGDYEAALKSLENALEIRKRYLGEDNTGVALIYNNIGRVYSSKGDYKEAAGNYEMALKIYMSLEEENKIALTHWNLGYVYSKLGNKDQALDSCKEAYNKYMKILGEDHPNTKAAKARVEKFLE